MTAAHDTTPAKRRRRRRHRRKSAVAVVPLAQSEAAPPDPGPIEQPATDAAGNQFYPGGPGDEDEVGPISPGKRKASRVAIEVPVRTAEILQWAAAHSGMTLDGYLTQVLASVAASMRPEWRRSQIGRFGGSVRARDIGKITE